MKRYQAILSIAGGLSLLVLLIIGTTTALLTDKDQKEHMFEVKAETVDIELAVSGLTGNSTEVVSGQTFDIKPVITNNGTANVLAFMEIDVPMVESTPIFTYTADESAWTFVSTKTEDGYQKSIYSYGSMTVLDAGSDTSEHPLIEKATFASIRSESDIQLTLIIKAYAATDAGFEGSPGNLEPEAVWTTTLNAVRE